MKRKLRPLTKEEIAKLPISKNSPIDKIDRYSHPFAHHKLIANAVKDYYEKAIQDRLDRLGPDAIINTQEEKS